MMAGSNSYWKSMVARVLGSTLFLSVLSGCLGAPVPNGHWDSEGQLLPRSSGISADLFVSSAHQNQIQVYDSQPPYALRRQITRGLVGPNGLLVDPAGNLYVANADGKSIVRYAPGKSTPDLVYRAKLRNPVTLALGHDGTLYVTDFTATGSTRIFAYPVNHLTPTRELFIAEAANGIALDAHDNLFVSLADFKTGKGSIMRFAPNAKHGTNLGISFGFAGRIAIDNRGRLLVCDQTAPAIDIYNMGMKRPWKRITKGLVDPFALAFDPSQSHLYVADGAYRAVRVYSYPELNLLKVIRRSTAAYGIAAGPSKYVLSVSLSQSLSS